jgi:hypothetical protein
MATKNLPKKPSTRWTAVRRLSGLILFLIITVLIEVLIVLYALSLGTEDVSVLQWSFVFPGTDWNVTLAISPLFHLVPIAVIITLVASWAYLAKYMAMRPQQTWRGKAAQSSKTLKKPQSRVRRAIGRFFGRIKSRLLKVKALAYLAERTHSSRALIRSALTVLLLFSFFIIVVSLLTYPQLIYRLVSNAYQNNPGMLDFVRGAGEALSPIGNFFSGLNNALLSAAPGFRDFAIGLGNSIKSLSELDSAGRYLVFQNGAAWIAVILALLIVEFQQKGFGYVRKK